MSGPVDVLACYAQDTGAFRVSNKGATELAAACAAVAELIEAMVVAQGDLHMLKKAIEARDPWPELLVRATDTERDLRTALSRVGGAS